MVGVATTRDGMSERKSSLPGMVPSETRSEQLRETVRLATRSMIASHCRLQTLHQIGQTSRASSRSGEGTGGNFRSSEATTPRNTRCCVAHQPSGRLKHGCAGIKL